VNQELREIHTDWLQRKDEEDERDAKKTQGCEVGGDEETMAAEVSAEVETPVASIPKNLPADTIDIRLPSSILQDREPRPPSKVGDLSNFGKISITMGPGVRAGKKGAAKRDSTLTRVDPTPNTSTTLGKGREAMPETSSKPSQPSSRRTSVDLGAPEPQRKKLQLLPRSKRVKEGDKVNCGSPGLSEGKGNDNTPQAMSEAEANARIAKDIKQLFSVRNIDESEEYFTKLPSEHHHRLVDKMVSKAIESKEADGKLVADAFARVVEKHMCSISAFEEGFSPIAELLDDIAIDAPKAFQIMATMMKGAGLDKDEERRTRIARKLMDSDKLLELLA
jgi:translation initiation factor 4G